MLARVGTQELGHPVMTVEVDSDGANVDVMHPKSEYFTALHIRDSGMLKRVSPGVRFLCERCIRYYEGLGYRKSQGLVAS